MRKEQKISQLAILIELRVTLSRCCVEMHYGTVLREVSLFTFTLTIIYLVYPPKFCISIVSRFSWEDCKSQEKLETMLTCKRFGVNKVYCGNVKVANQSILIFFKFVHPCLLLYLCVFNTFFSCFERLFYVSLSLVAVPTVWILLNFVTQLL